MRDLKFLVLSLMKMIHIKVFYSWFNYQFKSLFSTKVIAVTSSLYFIFEGKVVLLKALWNHIKFQGEVMKIVTLENCKFILLKLTYMKAENINLQYDRNIDISNNELNKELLQLNIRSENIYLLIRINDINKISNINKRCLDIISEANIPTKMKVCLNSKSEYDEISIAKLMKVACHISIRLNNSNISNEEMKF